MKAIKFILVAVLVFVALGLNGWGQESGADMDDYGKVIGQIIDEETLLPVKEKFLVKIFDSLDSSFFSKALKYNTDSDVNGKFSIEIPPGFYYMQCIPQDYLSKYEWEPSPLISNREKMKFKVLRGGITKIRKVAKYGGMVHLILVNDAGEKINPMNIANWSGIDMTMIGENLLGILHEMGDQESGVNLTGNKDDFDDGNMVIGRLPVGSYSCQLSYGTIGYADQEVGNISITRGKITVKNIVLNLNDNTGIEGMVVDEAGNLVSGALIEININDGSPIGMCKTGSNGYYKIVGLKNGVYNLFAESTINKNLFYGHANGISIIKGTIHRKNITVKQFGLRYN